MAGPQRTEQALTRREERDSPLMVSANEFDRASRGEAKRNAGATSEMATSRETALDNLAGRLRISLAQEDECQPCLGKKAAAHISKLIEKSDRLLQVLHRGTKLAVLGKDQAELRQRMRRVHRA